MRASVVIASSVNASFNANKRNTHFNGREPEIYTFSKTVSRGPRPVKRHPRVAKPQSFEDFPPPVRRKTVDTKNIPERVPFPRPVAPSRESSVSTSSEGSLRSTSDTAVDVADATPRDDVFVRCLAFLKHIGENIVMPPYTIHEGPSNAFTGRRSYIDLNASTTKLPLV